MKVDNSLFTNKHRLKKDTAFVKSLYKLVWNDEALNSRLLCLFQNLRKLDVSVCEVNLSPVANQAAGLGFIRFLKLTNVAFTKPNTFHNLLKSSSTLEVFSFCLFFLLQFFISCDFFVIISNIFLFSFLLPKVLVVRDCTNVTEYDFEPVVNHPSLYKLVIRGRALSAATWKQLQGSPNLKQLGVDMLPDMEDSDVIVAQALASLPRLKSLIFGVKLVNDDFIETLSQYKNPFSNITKLYLGGTFVFLIFSFLFNDNMHSF